jgi:alkanesulfonate monooxygenase SsuD/methylene tetrahydromethanopterin reductase-like flavin-dependent oxidoreductase (luciferase family)
VRKDKRTDEGYLAMKMGYFHNIHDVTRERDYEEMVNELREIAIYCDTAGFHAFWLPEHHFSIWGREMLPNPILMAADVAARTRNIRIGLAAAIITHWHPLRLAEDLCMLDQLSGGRLEIGVGRGNYGLEALNLNPIADPNDQDANFKAFSETLNVIKTVFTNKRFSFKGDIYTYPAPGFTVDRAHTVDDPDYIDAETGELIKLSIYPGPKQTPHPPLWQVVSDSPRSIQFAAENELGIIMWRHTVASLKSKLRMYRDWASEAQGRDVPMGARTAILRDTFVAESEKEAREIAGEAVMGGYNFSNWRGPGVFLNPGEKLDPDLEESLKKELTFDFVNERSLLFGSPDDIVDKLMELWRETNIEQVVFNCSREGVSHEHTMRSIRLLAEEVIPKVKARIDAAAVSAAE